MPFVYLTSFYSTVYILHHIYISQYIHSKVRTIHWIFSIIFIFDFVYPKVQNTSPCLYLVHTPPYILFSIYVLKYVNTWPLTYLTVCKFNCIYTWQYLYFSTFTLKYTCTPSVFYYSGYMLYYRSVVSFV